MQGAHGYGGYGYGGYGYDAGAYSSAGGGYGYGAGAYGSAAGGYGYDAGGYGYDTSGYGPAAGGSYYSNGYPPAPAYEDPLAAGRRAHDVPAPLNGLELQPSEACPRNYVIFDQTCTKSRVMFHPSLAHKLGGPSSAHSGSCYGAGDGAGKKGACRDDGGGGGCSLRQKEDTEEIDALLSSEDDDDVVSTGRTPGASRDDGSSPDSTCSSSRRGEPRKKERMSKMMRTLRGMVPGGSQMDTPAVLDGAVRYLKSLKVEAKKLGVRGSGS
ncbi:transcription factor bHLH144-like [Panicum virgatum]|uniref:BHLH domain-containing protein n=1 Tax=Panicum virgatum TaxID=38727 RepID=A0A8T0X9D8_PANVG|nr:transcription factor bHLH144-like [Panicum virgatum]KAG2658172.1 hypothetical protein PVAP13_1KG259600 [Panicum virgatum]